MANGSVISFQRGQKANLNSVSKIPGQILFVLNSDNTGSIYYDDSSSARYRMSYDLKDTATTFSVSSNPVTTTTGRVYPVALDKDGYLAVNVPWVNYSVATTTTAGLMSATDKSKLDGIAAGAKTGTVTSVATGTGLTGGPITTTGTIKVKLASETALTADSTAASQTTNRIYSIVPDKSGNLAVVVPWQSIPGNATTSSAGLMSATDKAKLDGIAAGAKTGTVTSVATGVGLTGGIITTTGTLKVKLVSETALNADSTASTETSGRIYSIVPDKSGNLAVVVPWTDHTYSAATTSTAGLMSATDKAKLDGIAAGAKTGTVTSVATGIGLTGGTITTTGTLKVKLASETLLTADSTAATETANRIYSIVGDKSGNLAVVVPWTDHTYSAATTSTAGLMSAADKTKLDGIATGAKTGTVTSVATGVGLTGGTITTTGTLKAKLVSETALSADSTASTETANRIYGIVPDKSGNLAVVVPWTDHTYSNATTSTAGLMSASDKSKLDGIAAGAKVGTVTSVATGAGLTGGTITGTGTIKANLITETKLSANSVAATETTNRNYAIVLDKSGYLAVTVPWQSIPGNATTSSAGLMSAADKTKLDGIATGAKTGTVTSVATGAGLTGGTITTSGTLKVNLLNETKLTANSTAAAETANRNYAVVLDKSGYLAVTVPWQNIPGAATTSSAGLMSAADKQKLDGIAAGAKTGTVTSVATGVGLTGGTITTSGTLKVKLLSETALANDSTASTDNRATRVYPIAQDKSGYLAVVVPWDNTTYSAGTGISFSGTTINNTGIRSLAAGTNNGTTNVNGTDNQTIVKGLAALAFIGLDSGSATNKFLAGNGGWKALTTDDIPGLNASKITGGTLGTARGGTGNDTWTQWGVVYASTTTKLVNTGAGTSGYLLKANGSAAPSWVAQSDITAGSFSSNATVTLTGDATGTSAGSTKSWSVPVTLANSGVTANSYGPSANASPSFGQTFSVPKFTVDAKGRLTSAGTVTVTLPTYSAGAGLTLSGTTFKAKLKTETAFTQDSAAQTNTSGKQYMVGVDKSGYLSVNVPWTDNNTDTKVTQSGNNENKEFPILLKYTNSATDETNTVKYNNTAQGPTTINPSTGTISAKVFKVQSSVLIEYNATTESLNFVFS